MQNAGESLTETYARVQGSTLLLDDALNLIGASFEGARVDYVRLAADISEAAGGLQQAAGLWSSYFETFYSEQELFERELSDATSNRNSLLGGLGINTGIDVDAFRELFENALPTLSADAVVEWLRAADAIGVVVDLESDLNAQREENAAQLSLLVDSINDEIENMGLSDFQLRLKEIRRAMNDQIRTARELGATERELALIQTFATRQISNAISALENDVSGALTDLYGTELDQINEQISLLEQQQSSIGSVQQASDNLYDSQLRAIQNIQGFVRGLLLDEQLSPLNPEQQLAEAQSQFDELLALAQGGDVDALNALPALAQTLLGFGQDVFASSQDYVDIFENVTGSLSDLGVTATPQSPQGQVITQNNELIRLQRERNRLEAEFDSQARLDAARAIAAQLGDIASVTGESFSQLAERLNVPINEFLGDLGINIENVTDRTINSLNELSSTLGIDLSSLSTDIGLDVQNLSSALGLDLGNLSDALGVDLSSLTNGIDGLDTEIINSLGQLSTALGVDLTDLTGALSGDLSEFSNALGIDLSSIDQSTADALSSVANALGVNLDQLSSALGVDLSNVAGSIDSLIPIIGGGDGFVGPLPTDPIVEAIEPLTIANNQTRDQIQDLRNDEDQRDFATVAHRQQLIQSINTLATRIETFIDIQGVA